MKKLINLFCLFITLSSYAAESKIVTIEGSIRSFDNESIQISTTKGVRTIPRKFIPAKIKINAGESVKIPLTEEQLQEVK